MPNWCENDLTITGPSGELKKFVELVKGKNSLMDANKLIPYPEEFRTLDEEATKWDREVRENKAKDPNFSSLLENRPKNGFNSGGYEWCIDNWGTKWGFCEVKMISKSTTKPKGKVEYTFETAWSPPTPLIIKAGELFPSLRFEMLSYEGGMGFQATLVIEGGEVKVDGNDFYNGPRGG
jgi:hypothetical protein